MTAPSQSLSESRAERDSVSTSLLHRLRVADPEAWTRLVDWMGPVVYQWCRQAGLQPADAADVVQEVFRSVAAHLAAFRRDRGGDSFRGWLWTITHHRVQDWYRAKKARPEAFGGTDGHQQFQQLAEGPDLERSASSGLDADCLIARRVLETIRGDFDESTWQAFWRMTIEEHPSAEIAADLGISPDAVRSAKYRVLKRFREEIAGLL